MMKDWVRFCAQKECPFARPFRDVTKLLRWAGGSYVGGTRVQGDFIYQCSASICVRNYPTQEELGRMEVAAAESARAEMAEG